MMFTKTITSPYAGLSGLNTYCGAWPVSEWPADQRHMDEAGDQRNVIEKWDGVW